MSHLVLQKPIRQRDGACAWLPTLLREGVAAHKVSHHDRRHGKPALSQVGTPGTKTQNRLSCGRPQQKLGAAVLLALVLTSYFRPSPRHRSKMTKQARERLQ